MENQNYDLVLAVGELRGLVEGINARLDILNSKVSDTAKTVQKHEILFGKIGVVVVFVGFVVSSASTLIVQFFEKRFIR